MTSKRAITTANENALLDAVVRPIIFARLDFSSGVLRFHTGIGPKTATHPVHGSESYTGLGDFGGIAGDVVESTSSGEQVLMLGLSGVNATLVNISFVDNYYRRDVEIMLGLENSSGALVDDPVIIFSGFMEFMTVTLKEQIAQIMLRCNSRGSNLNRSSDVRYTDEDKQREFGGDLFAEYVYRMSDLELFWGDREFRSPFGQPRADPRVTPGGGRDPER